LTKPKRTISTNMRFRKQRRRTWINLWVSQGKHRLSSRFTEPSPGTGPPLQSSPTENTYLFIFDSIFIFYRFVLVPGYYQGRLGISWRNRRGQYQRTRDPNRRMQLE
jgi:hypothetical protein